MPILHETPHSPAVSIVRGAGDQTTNLRARWIRLAKMASPLFISDDETEDFLPLSEITTTTSSEILISKVEISTGLSYQEKSGFWGLLYVILASILNAIISVIVVSQATSNLSTVILLESLDILVINAPLVARRGAKIPRRNRKHLLLASLLEASCLYLRYYALRQLPLGPASVVIHGVPALLTVVMRVFLKDPCNIFHNLALAAVVMALVVTCRLPQALVGGAHVYETYEMTGFLAGFLACFLGTAHLILLWAMDLAPAPASLAWINLASFVQMSFVWFASQFPHVFPCSRPSLLTLGVCHYAYSILFFKLLRSQHASSLVLIKAFLDVFLHFLWQFAAFPAPVTPWTAYGATLVLLLSIVINAKKNGWIRIVKRRLLYRQVKSHFKI